MIEFLLGILKFITAPTCAAVLYYVFILGPRSGWKISFRRLWNAGTNLIMLVVNVCLKTSVLLGLGYLSFAAVDGFQLPHIPSNFWEAMLPGAAVLTALIVMDFTNYWAHRALHTKWLWGIHAIHHADDDISWTTTFRLHLFESFIMAGFFVLIVGWFNLPAKALGMAAVLRVWYAYYTHTQSGFNHGRYDKLFVSPNYHRWHHANAPEAYDKNLADMFPVWDVMFGTHYNPGPCQAKLGLGDEVPKGVVLSLSYPFKYWAGLLKDMKNRRPEKTALPS